MEILEILKNTGDEIYLEDLTFFETELATGNYAESYILACKEQIELVRKRLCGGDETNTQQSNEEALPNKKPNISLVMGIKSIAPQSTNPVTAAMSPEQAIWSDIKAIRDGDSSKTKFKKYVRESPAIDAAFVDAHYSLFTQWEVDAIVSIRQLGEAFLEKYFGALDKDKIARYQLFSESFFMKHYSQLDATIVLTQGKNEWRKRNKRSKQLDVFLRLKGVKL